ncbi:hypothetical protein N480_10180 [Pseudoalteromonas luteoviolacea S2607]|uniref:hypothetical protein n=1 Tax=Pseudoalteromonas luteoviolacea TaxID=43657 RepID=UPI0007B0490B|nr:hypothetical protein [Pseudoalteromonas luteoviolacea]KZN28452.1 hypothetical protein N480_10180 [Pseudoalteromonas luteoviolacea S2607]
MLSFIKKQCLVGLVLATLLVVIGFALLRPVTFKLTSSQDYQGYLVQVVDKGGNTIESYVVDSTLELKSHRVLRWMIEGTTLNVVHPLVRAKTIVLTPSILLKGMNNLNLSCWCADKTYPVQQDLLVVYAHFATLKTDYIPIVDVAIRTKSVEGHSKALYMMTAVASAREGNARRLSKVEARKMRAEIGEIIAQLYIN